MFQVSVSNRRFPIVDRPYSGGPLWLSICLPPVGGVSGWPDGGLEIPETIAGLALTLSKVLILVLGDRFN